VGGGGRFKNPVGPTGLPLYACTTIGGQTCGRPVAVKFCQAKGWSKVMGFDTVSLKVKAETIEGVLCSKKQCRVFEVIQCQK
jgi:hypothetical protein